MKNGLFRNAPLQKGVLKTRFLKLYQSSTTLGLDLESSNPEKGGYTRNINWKFVYPKVATTSLFYNEWPENLRSSPWIKDDPVTVEIVPEKSFSNKEEVERNFLLLSIAYASNIGGTGVVTGRNENSSNFDHGCGWWEDKLQNEFWIQINVSIQFLSKHGCK